MSDDGYHSDFDGDYEEILWFDDSIPELADDLAEHAAYSPIWLENPADELKDYFSDWEYYTDDYQDDDPVTIKQLNISEVSSTTVPVPSKEKRGRKRKLEEVQKDNRYANNIEQAFQGSFLGTVWMGDQTWRKNTYTLGKEPKVKLSLSNEVMFAAYNKTRGFGQSKIERDESWAMDMSLAEMGLQTKRSINVEQHNTAEDRDATDEALPAEDVESEDGGDTKQDTTFKGLSYLAPDVDDDLPRKRQRTRVTKNPERSTQSRQSQSDTSEEGTNQQQEPDPDPGPIKKSRGRPLREHKTTDVGTLGNETAAKGHKRKLSAESTATASTIGTKAKRVARGTVSTAMNRTTRATRSTKK